MWQILPIQWRLEQRVQDGLHIRLKRTAVNAIVDNVHKNKPEEGLIQLLTVTEKQYSKMDIVIGNVKSEVLDSDERLVIL